MVDRLQYLAEKDEWDQAKYQSYVEQLEREKLEIYGQAEESLEDELTTVEEVRKTNAALERRSKQLMRERDEAVNENLVLKEKANIQATLLQAGLDGKEKSVATTPDRYQKQINEQGQQLEDAHRQIGELEAKLERTDRKLKVFAQGGNTEDYLADLIAKDAKQRQYMIRLHCDRRESERCEWKNERQSWTIEKETLERELKETKKQLQGTREEVQRANEVLKEHQDEVDQLVQGRDTSMSQLTAEMEKVRGRIREAEKAIEDKKSYKELKQAHQLTTTAEAGQEAEEQSSRDSEQALHDRVTDPGGLANKLHRQLDQFVNAPVPVPAPAPAPALPVALSGDRRVRSCTDACFCTLLETFLPGAYDALGGPGRRQHGHGDTTESGHVTTFSGVPDFVCRVLTAVVWLLMLAAAQPSGGLALVMLLATYMTRPLQLAAAWLQLALRWLVGHRPAARPRNTLVQIPDAAMLVGTTLSLAMAFNLVAYMSMREQQHRWLELNERMVYCYDELPTEPDHVLVADAVRSMFYSIASSAYTPFWTILAAVGKCFSFLEGGGVELRKRGSV